MANRIYVPTTGPQDWRRLLGDPQKHWRDGYSAKTCAHAWEEARGLPACVASHFDKPAELLIAIPEHKVALPGRGADSQCDVFALVRTGGRVVALSVEAKVDEPFDVTVGEWLDAGRENRQERMDGLCALLDVATPRRDTRYQLYHRAAAAVIEARRFGAGGSAMIVQSFSAVGRWREDFEAFAHTLGARPEGIGYRHGLGDGTSLYLGCAGCAPG